MNELVSFDKLSGMKVSLGPTLLVLGSVQTFCIDPLKEVFGVEEMAAGAVGGGGRGRCYSGYSFQVKN